MTSWITRGKESVRVSAAPLPRVYVTNTSSRTLMLSPLPTEMHQGSISVVGTSCKTSEQKHTGSLKILAYHFSTPGRNCRKSCQHPGQSDMPAPTLTSSSCVKHVLGCVCKYQYASAIYSPVQAISIYPAGFSLALPQRQLTASGLIFASSPRFFVHSFVLSMSMIPSTLTCATCTPFGPNSLARL